jgi:hypothetical protein
VTPFRSLLVVIFATVAVYTGIVASRHGPNLLPVFFGDIAGLAWPGQFNLDFMCLLALTGLWVAWRHRFGAAGIALGLVAVFGGVLFLSAYLFVESRRAQGDVRALLLGSRLHDR